MGSGMDRAAARPKRRQWRRWLPVLVLAAAVAAFFASGLGRYLTWDSFREHRQWLLDWIAREGALAALGFILVYTAVAALSVPGGAVLTLASGFLFGTWLGGLYSLIGATVGGSIIFLVARTALGGLLRERAGPALRRVEAGFQEDGASYLLFLRLVPLFPFWLVNLVSAFFGLSLRTFVLCSFFGMAPATFVYASVGAGAGAVFDAGETPDLRVIFEPRVLLPLVALSLLALVPALYKKLKRERAP